MPQVTGVEHLTPGWAFSDNVYHCEVSGVQRGKFYFPLMHHLMDSYHRREAGLQGTTAHSKTALMNISEEKSIKKSSKELSVYQLYCMR